VLAQPGRNKEYKVIQRFRNGKINNHSSQKNPEKLCNSQVEHCVTRQRNRLRQFVCLTVEPSEDIQKYVMSKFDKA